MLFRPGDLPQPGERVGDFIVVASVGHGAQGAVIKARNGSRYYAVKFIDPYYEGTERLEREVQIHLRCRHEGIACIRGYGRWPDARRGRFYIVTDFVDGLNMSQWLYKKCPRVRHVAQLFLRIARAAREMHRKGVFHRDLKPENILITRKGSRPVIIDFGSGCLRKFTTLNEKLGIHPHTPEYLSPEAWRFKKSRQDHGRDVCYRYTATDEVWALGVTFYEALTACLPFGSRYSGDFVEAILNKDPPAPNVVNPRIPQALSDLCMRMLVKNPQDRLPSMDALCGALEEMLAQAKDDPAWDLAIDHDTKPDEVGTLTADAVADAPGAAVDDIDESLTPTEPDFIKQRMTDSRLPTKPLQTADIFPVAIPRRAGLATKIKMRQELLEFIIQGGKGVAIIAGFLGLMFYLVLPPDPPRAPPTDARSTNVREEWASLRKEPLPPPDFLPKIMPPMVVATESGPEGLGAPTEPTPNATMKTMNKKAESQESKRTRTLGGTVAGITTTGALLACCATPEVRNPPAPTKLDCPAGAKESMKKLGIDSVPFFYVLPGHSLEEDEVEVTVRPGPFTVITGETKGSLPAGTLLKGQLILTSTQVNMLFTEARIPSGDAYIVCLKLAGETVGFGWKRDPGDAARGSTKIWSFGKVERTQHFDY